MWPLFEQMLARYRELEQQLADPEVAVDRAGYTRVAKEHVRHGDARVVDMHGKHGVTGDLSGRGLGRFEIADLIELSPWRLPFRRLDPWLLS